MDLLGKGAIMSHTPGPWSVDVRQIVAGNGFVVASVKGPHPTAKGKEWHEDNRFCEANAALIAAAPELLLALEAVIRWMESPAEGPFSDYQLQQARAALAKARGRG